MKKSETIHIKSPATLPFVIPRVSVVLDTKYNGQIVGMGATKAAFRATTTINRFDYGVHWDKTIESGGLVVGKNIDITLLLEFNKQSNDKK